MLCLIIDFRRFKVGLKSPGVLSLSGPVFRGCSHELSVDCIPDDVLVEAMNSRCPLVVR